MEATAKKRSRQLKSFLVTYTLHGASRDDYRRVEWAIDGGFEHCWRCMKSAWIVRTELSAEEVHAALAVRIKDSDSLAVLGLNGDFSGRWAWPSTKYAETQLEKLLPAKPKRRSEVS